MTLLHAKSFKLRAAANGYTPLCDSRVVSPAKNGPLLTPSPDIKAAVSKLQL